MRSGFMTIAGGTLAGEGRGIVKTLWVILGALFVTTATTATTAGSAWAGQVEEAVAAAMRDVDGGRCEEAAARLRGIDGLASRASLLNGRCRIAKGQYSEALEELDRAHAAGDLTPDQLGELELHRGVALYHLERFAEAETALAQADGLASDEAQLTLYRGLIALRNNDNDRAAPALESAARLSPSTMEPVASYYAGLAWQGAAERTKAREAFQRVIDIDPDGAWGKEAAKLLESNKLFPFFARLRVGFENDDNVLLRATGTDRVTRGGDKDWRGVWQLETGIQLFSEGPWAGGLLASYSGSKHHDLTDFDVHYPTLGTFLDYRFAPLTISRLRYNFGYAWVRDGSFLSTHLIQGSLKHTWERLGTTEILGDVTFNNFLFRNQDAPPGSGNPGLGCPAPIPTTTGCGPLGLDESIKRNRDGYGLGAAVEHSYLLPIPAVAEPAFESAAIRGGYRFEFYDSQGTEWERFGHILSAGFSLEFPLDISFDATAAYERYDYLNPSTFPDNEVSGDEYALDQDDREEDAFSVSAEIEKDFGEYVSVSGRYSYYDSASNRRVYDYRRHVVGAYVNLRFD